MGDIGPVRNRYDVLAVREFELTDAAALAGPAGRVPEPGPTPVPEPEPVPDPTAPVPGPEPVPQPPSAG
jgi:hypothetical protein